MEIRRLDPEKDIDLYKQSFDWDKDYPRWYQDAEKVARVDFDEWMERSNERADVGVFDPDFTALISVICRAPQIFEVHFWAKRKTNLERLGLAALNVRRSLERLVGMRGAFAWIVKRNAPVKRLCGMIGFVPDGATLVDGESHGKPITWIRVSCENIEVS